MTYPGGKNGSGVYQRIINHMPPHQTYIEGFLGSGAVLRNKKPALRNIGIDLDEKALMLAKSLSNGGRFEWWHNSFFNMSGHVRFDASTLIYLDPPYMSSTRKGGDLYKYELTDQQHIELLNLVLRLPCMVMLSGYRSYVYDEMLTDWTRIDYETQTRRGMVNECLWMNFPIPTRLHDYSHLGCDYRERERIKRKKDRWMKKLSAMNRQERLAIMDALTSVNESH